MQILDILSLSENAIVTAEVQVRPDDVEFQHEIKEKTLFVSCGAENGKPFASSKIIIDESLGRTISGDGIVNASYQLTQAFDGKVFFYIQLILERKLTNYLSITILPKIFRIFIFDAKLQSDLASLSSAIFSEM